MSEKRVTIHVKHGEHCGYKWRILQMGENGWLCGYVGLPKGHPLAGKDYGEIYEMHDVECHGGLTYCEPGDGGRFQSGLWWIGFDCAHSGDYIPAFDRKDEGPRDYETHKDADYVEAECIKLATQMDDIQKLPDGFLGWRKAVRSYLEKKGEAK